VVGVDIGGVGEGLVCVQIVPTPRGHLAATTNFDVLAVADQGGLAGIAGGLWGIPAEVVGPAPVLEALARVVAHRAGWRDLEFLKGLRRLVWAIYLGRAGTISGLLTTPELDKPAACQGYRECQGRRQQSEMLHRFPCRFAHVRKHNGVSHLVPRCRARSGARPRDRLSQRTKQRRRAWDSNTPAPFYALWSSEF
jgi:hypothetical protein